jgi:DNA mismatch repair protein MSH5
MENFKVSELQEVGQMIHDTIDFEESSLQHRVVVKRHIDEELDRMKRMYDGLDDMLGQVARQIAAEIPGPVDTTLNVIYFPQLGYLIVVPADEKGGSIADGSSGEVSGRPSYTGDDWEFQFSTETSWYYKSPQMREMDNYFGDMYGLICGGFWQLCLTSDI